MSFLRNNLSYLIFGCLLFLFSAIYITFPLIFHLGDYITGYGDQYLHAYIMNWVIHSLFTNPLNIFHGSIYYPYLNPIAYSDLFITSSIIAIIPLWIIGQPITVVNFTFLSSIFMVGFFTFLLSFYLTKNFWASIISGLLIIFSPAFLDKKTHIQILSIQWIPLSILSFIVFVKSLKSKYLFISLVFFLLQFYNSFLPGYFLVFFYFLYIFFAWINNKTILKKLFTKNNLIIILLTICTIIPIVKPYYDVYKQYNAQRDIRDSIHFALQPEDLIYPSEHTRLAPLLLKIANLEKVTRVDEIKYGYLGFVFSLLIIASLIYFVKNFKFKNTIEDSFIFTGLLGLILSFGPALHVARQTIHKPFLIILPYAVFYYIIPGFKGFRNSERWEILFIFCLAIFISIFLTKALKNKKSKTQIIIYTILIFAIIAEYNFPMKFYSVVQKKDFPKVYQWQKTTAKNSVFITMPIYNWNSPNSSIELEREYFYTGNFRSTVNGYSGFSPIQWQNNVTYLFNNFPNNESINIIKKLGVNYIIVNKNEYDYLFKNKYYLFGNGDKVISTLNKYSMLKLIKVFDNSYVYSFNFSK